MGKECRFHSNEGGVDLDELLGGIGGLGVVVDVVRRRDHLLKGLKKIISLRKYRKEGGGGAAKGTEKLRGLGEDSMRKKPI